MQSSNYASRRAVRCTLDVFSSLIVIVTMVSASATQAQTIILDTEFDNDDWRDTEYFDFSGTGTYGTAQVLSGYPGLARLIQLNMNAQSGTGVSTTKRDQWYNPATQGTIGYLNANLDARFDTAFVATRINYWLTAIQWEGPDSTFYWASIRTIDGLTFDDWVPLAWQSITADSFESVAPGIAHPDFSSSGGPIYFGIMVLYSVQQPGPSSAVTTIDNFRVKVYNCAGDPLCDAVVNVQDIVATIDVAFRSGSSTTDPGCGWERSDLNCDGATGIVDVVRIVNVAFRGADPLTEFCNPCP